VVSYFKGPREAWHTGLPTYAGVRYRDLWPGIDLVWSGEEGRLKSSFIVKPGADPGQIRLRWRGASKVRVGPEGELEVATPVGNFAEQRPVAYQEAAGGKLEVAASYWLRGREYGFRLGEYDRNRELVVDPVMLLYAGYIGGVGNDYGWAIAVDASGNAYVAGQTDSAEASFPATVGPDQTHNGKVDAFVAKVNASGTALIYAGYIGGSEDDYGWGIAVDATGSAYVTGYTSSTQATFPVTVGPDLTHNGLDDAFVAKLNPSGTALVYAGYIGGSGYERGYGIAVDAAGNAYVTGSTGSTEASFPVVVGPDLTFNGDSNDAFVAKVNPSGSALVYAGYIGGSQNDYGYGIAVDMAGNAYVTGYTYSTEASFPVTVGPDLTHNGQSDAFVVKVNASGTALVYAGYIGGSDYDYAYGIAVDAAGNAYVTGHTASTQGSFPVSVGPDLTHNGYTDAFVAKVSASGTALVYAGYIGGSGYDYAYGIAVDVAGNAYVAGTTFSTESSFPVKVGPDLTHNGEWDAFVAKVNAAGTMLVYAGYIGGSAQDAARGVAVDGAGNAYVTGHTRSTDATFPVTVGPDSIYNGGDFDAFVAKISSAAPTAVFRDSNTSMRLLTRYDSPQLYYGAGLFASDPAAAQTARGDTVIVARDNWGSLWASAFTAATQSWGTWAFGAGITQGVPAVAVAGDGKAYIAARDNWNSYWLVSYTPGASFGNWEYLAGIFSTDPVVAACPDGSLYIIGKDNWNSLWGGRYVPGSGFSGWQWGQGIVKGKPSVACGSDNVAYVVVRDDWDSMWLARMQGNSWLGWSYGGGIMSGDPQAVAARNGTIYAVLRDPWAVLWYRGYQEGSSGGWLSWVMTGGVLQDFAAAGELGEVYIAGRSLSNELWWYRLATNQWTYAGYGGVAAGPPAAAPR